MSTIKGKGNKMSKKSNAVKKTAEVAEPRILDDLTQNEPVTIVPPVVEQSKPADKGTVSMTMEQLESLGLKSKSSVIRYLAGAGYTRSAIAKFLNIRYQHVRNVLITPLKTGAATSAVQVVKEDADNE